MRIHVITIFPDLFPAFLDAGIVGRAIRSGLAAVEIHDLRAFTHDRHRTVDDAPFGGGPGMLMRPEPLSEAIASLSLGLGAPVVLLTPQGRQLTQRDAERLSAQPEVAMICGRYEGVDERIRTNVATEEISIGDYVLTGGELPAQVVIDAMIRLLPGALGHGDEALADDSHTSGLLQYPQYTRPADYQGQGVPDVLVSGDHSAIAAWRRQEALRRTLERRPDLLDKAPLTTWDEQVLRQLGWVPDRER